MPGTSSTGTGPKRKSSPRTSGSDPADRQHPHGHAPQRSATPPGARADARDVDIPRPLDGPRNADRRARASRLGEAEIAQWLSDRVDGIGESWIRDIRSRGLGRSSLEDVVERFAEQIVKLLPLMLGPHRSQVRSLWVRAAELYGAIAAKRGLAAGEAIEEVHVLRELVIRELYRDPPAGGQIPLSLREVLRLNRSLDRAVTHASVGHTDSLFFEFFGAEGGRSVLSGDDIAAEANEQLAAVRDEVESIVAHANGAKSGAPTGPPSRDR